MLRLATTFCLLLLPRAALLGSAIRDGESLTTRAPRQQRAAAAAFKATHGAREVREHQPPRWGLYELSALATSLASV